MATAGQRSAGVSAFKLNFEHQAKAMGCGPDGKPTGKFVVYLVATLIPDWAPPAPARHRALVGRKAEAVLAGAVAGKSLRELAREVGVSHETIRGTLKAVE